MVYGNEIDSTYLVLSYALYLFGEATCFMRPDFNSTRVYLLQDNLKGIDIICKIAGKTPDQYQKYDFIYRENGIMIMFMSRIMRRIKKM